MRRIKKLLKLRKQRIFFPYHRFFLTPRRFLCSTGLKVLRETLRHSLGPYNFAGRREHEEKGRKLAVREMCKKTGQERGVERERMEYERERSQSGKTEKEREREREKGEEFYF